MTNKDHVLAQLIAAQGSYLSGSTMASQLGISRAAVGKIIGRLESEGYTIDAVPNRGYRLETGWDDTSAAGIDALLPSGHPYQIQVFDSLPSTNAYLKGLSQPQEGQVVIAKAQTAGYGRLGRSFYSPAHTGIYLSVLLTPTPQQLPLLTALAGVAVCRALALHTGLQPCIKWVNDIWLDEKKVCGILSEASISLENPEITQVVLGIGLNLYTPQEGFPDALSSIACGAQKTMVPGGKSRLIAQILTQLDHLYHTFDPTTLVQSYKDLSGILGREIFIHRGGTQIPARAVDIDDACCLVVDYPDGRRETLHAGNISIRLEADA